MKAGSIAKEDQKASLDTTKRSSKKRKEVLSKEPEKAGEKLEKQRLRNHAASAQTQNRAERGAKGPTEQGRKQKKQKNVKAEVESNTQDSLEEKVKESPQKAGKKRKRIDVEEAESRPRRKRKTAAEKEQEAMPLMPRTPGLAMKIGAHVSIAKGVQNAVTNSVHVGANAFALFLKSHRKWENPQINLDDAKLFREYCQREELDARKHVLPHGSYLMNLANADADKQKQAYDCFIDDLKRCEILGIGLYNWHPGSTLGQEKQTALENIARAINRAHKETTFVKTVLENMAGHGNIIGSSFEDLAGIISLVTDKSRVGVCLDTCHAFAAGYDLRTEEAYQKTMQQFDDIVGLKYLSALHINDSKTPFGAKRDLHQNIGLGFLGLEPFRIVVNDDRLADRPLILETPQSDQRVWADEIKLLEWCIGKSGREEDFLSKARELSDRGLEERAKATAFQEKKAAKGSKKRRSSSTSDDSQPL